MNKKSFTLIELLVVIAIIGILSSLVIARFSDWGDNARIANTLQWSAGVHRTLGANLVGRWPLNGDLDDISGYGNSGTCSSCPIFHSENPAGEGQSLFFDGETRQVDLKYLFEDKKSYTASAWVYLNSSFPNDKSSRFLSSTTTGAGRWYMIARNNSLSINTYFEAGYDYWLTFNMSVPHDQWFHFMAVFDRMGDESIYYNGERMISRDISLALHLNWAESPAIISSGTKGAATYVPHEGSLSDIRIYDAVLTAEEVGRIYTETKDSYLVYE